MELLRTKSGASGFFDWTFTQIYSTPIHFFRIYGKAFCPEHIT